MCIRDSTIAALGLILLGTLVVAISILGLFRFRDALERIHAGAVTDTLGAVSYTHLDVYKRQDYSGPSCPYHLLGPGRHSRPLLLQTTWPEGALRLETDLLQAIHTL